VLCEVDFWEKNVPKLADFEDFYFVLGFWNRHIQTIGSSMLWKYSGILKNFYFLLWTIAKFG
jgi:hypothetical protein